MTRESKEFKRRLNKMQKHVEALRPIAGNGEPQVALDEIQEALNDLEGHREARENPTQAGVAG